MSVGRISGPLLKANLLRDGVDLAFENDLLYLDVNNLRVGINTSTPTHDLHVNGTTRTTYLQVDNQLDIDNITITGNTITSNVPTLNLIAASDGVIYQNRLTIDQIDIQDNFITTNTTNADLEIRVSGTGTLKVYSNMFVDGNIHATGNITADGSITLGDQNTDNIVFNADVNSDIIPNITDFYDLGSPTNRWNSIWTNNFIATNVLATNVIVDGVDVSQIQGNIIYVSSLGDNTNSGYHQNDCLATIEYALSLAVSGDTVYIYPGTYEEITPLVVPVGVTIKGSSLRNVIITPRPSTRTQDVFLVNGESTIEDLTVKGHFYDSLNNTGHAFRFDNNFKVTLRSPYIRNVSVITFGTPTSLAVATYQAQNDGSILRIKDIIDEIVTNGPITPSVGNTETQVTDLSNPSDGTTASALQALIDDVLYIISNGASNSNLPTIVANGVLTTDAVKLNAAALINDNINFLKAEMVAWVNVNYPGFWLTYDQTKAERDLGIILDALIYDIQHGGNEETIKAGIGYWQYFTTDPRGYDQGDAGRGAFIDGSVTDPTTNEASMLFHSVTFLCPGVDTIIMTEGVRVEWLNCFTYWATKGLYAYSGTTGKGGAGKTILAVDGVVGTYNIGDTIEYYAEDGVTLLGSGIIADINGSKVYINGKASGFIEFGNRVGKPVVASGSAQISTTQSRFGGSSGQFVTATTDKITIAANDDFAFGTGDFTVEFWIYPVPSASPQGIFDMRTSGVAQAALLLDLSASNLPRLYINGAYRITGTALSDNTWHHVAISRVSGVTRMFLNGTVQATTYTDTNNYPAKPLVIGSYYNNLSFLNAYIDDFRISKGIGRYTGTFSVPTTPYGSDSYTVLLLHFDGLNGSTTYEDDSTLVQDIRFTPSGATATQFTLVDYADFGAEVRSIGSACVYGDYGIYGDGEGVIMYLIGQNLAYIGLGGSQENDPLQVIQANEIVELNGSNIYYSSVDHKGDFRVGDLFYINQQTGAVQFTNSIINIIGSTGLTLTDGSNVTIITPTKIETGDIRISGNTIESLTNDINIVAANNNINLLSDVNISGSLDVVGNVTIGGNITLGDQTTDSVQFIAGIDSNIIPNLSATYNIGSSNLQWKDLWVRTAHISDIEISTNYIRTTISNADLELRANGTGSILVEDIRVNQNVISTDSGNIQITPATTLDVTASTTNVNGTMHVTGNVSIDTNTTLGTDATDNVVFNARVNTDIIPSITSAYDLGSSTNAWKTAYLSSAFVDDILIDTNIIQTIVSNSNLELRANGTGSIQLEQTYINENLIYTVGNNLLIQPATTLDITASTTNVNGDLHVTGNVSLDSNVVLGSDSSDNVVFNARVSSNIVPTYTATYDLGSSSKAWRNAWLASAYIDDIYIDTNIITTIASNANLELRANGTGAIRIEKIDINENLIKTNGTDNLLIQPATTLDITASTTNVNGDLHVTGNSRFDGNLDLGTDSTDNIVFNARVNSNIEPNFTATYNLGSPSKNWRIAHLSSAYIDNIYIDTNIITTTESNANLELKANGTGAIRVEQVDINENVISTNGATNLILDPATTLDILGDTNITGDLNVTGNVTIGGNITVGNQDTDNITFAAEINSDIIPNIPVTYNLGSSAKRWKTLFAENTFISDIEINTNVIRTTVSNADLELRANGTGGIKLEDITVNQNIISAASGTNIVMQPSGTGIVDINTTQAIRIPRGTTAERPGTPTIGMIRYNTDNNNYEGYDGTYWRVINGLYDVDQNTYLVAEATPGSNNNTFYFVANGSQIADMTATRLNAVRVEVDDIFIDNNTIGSINNQSIDITAAGTGTVIIEDFSFKNNVITNTVTNGVTELTHSGTGYFKIAGTTGFRVPVGNAVQRPDTTINPASFIGFTRYNTDDNRLEIYDGVTWQSAAGTSSGVTVAQAEDIAIATVLTLG